ncbi:transmembrane 6 superfamily member 1-like [Asterias rubens]|uniref:transmembrane 6 superfamily member 1-like n=1 Tax=Asterias rubens TaxID=7604 RepID=UPI001455C86B|nr:transmembrane 6 superfamily member 1-like [Asterias rubens]
MSTATGIFLLSLTAIPTCYLLNQVQTFSKDHRAVFAVGCLILPIIVALAYLISRRSKPKDWFFYVFSLFAWTSIVDLILAMQADGLIANFIDFYLIEGEPYLNTAYGLMINYWDASGHYCMYIMMVTAIVWNENYREVGLFWVGSVMNSLCVFLPGNVLGKFGGEVRSSFFLNTPYIFLPLYAGYKFLHQRKPDPPAEKSSKSGSILSRPIDLIFVLYLAAATLLAFIRVMAAMDSPYPPAQAYLKNYEPYLQDPVAYPKMQMLVFWFYYVPYYGATIWSLVKPGKSWVADWAIIHAGASAQAQISHIGASLHSNTPYIYRVPAETQSVFLVINVALLVMPQLLAWRCYSVANSKKSLSNKEN